jgi:Fic family protein
MQNLQESYERILKQYTEEIVSNIDTDHFKTYNEVLFTAHSSAIEGNSFTVDETRELKEKGIALKLHNKSLFEAYEIIDHFNAYTHVMQGVHEPLTEQLLKDTHALLMARNLNYKTGENPGEYTTKIMTAGDTIFGDPKKNIESMPKLIKATQDSIEKGTVHPMKIAASFHKYFIYLHPFRDGNGRLGRLFSNWILTKLKHPLVIIESQNKQVYIDALKSSQKHRDNTPLISFFFETAIARMTKELAEKNTSTTRFDIH